MRVDRKVESFHISVNIGGNAELVEVFAYSRDAALRILYERGYDLNDPQDIARVEGAA